MASFKLLHAKDKIYSFKLGNTVYYLDSRDKGMIKLYDSELKRLNVIMPEGWLYNTTKGEVSLLILRYMAEAYSNGYKNGYKSKLNNYFKDFVIRLKNVLNDNELGQRFKNLFSIELLDYQITKKRINALISNDQLLHKNEAISRNMLERTLKAAINNEDELLITDITNALESLPPSDIDSNSDLYDIFGFKEFELPLILANIEKLEKSKDV